MIFSAVLAVYYRTTDLGVLQVMSIHVLVRSKKQTQFWMMTEKCLTIDLFCLNTGNCQYASVNKELCFTISEHTIT